MLLGFSALNESSNAESVSSVSNDSKSQESLDFRDDDYLSLYNKALASYGDGNYDRAEGEFRHLVKTPYFTHCGFRSLKPRAIAIKLQFNSHRYLGLCLSKHENYSEALDQLEKALEIDSSDPTLYFRFAIIAVKAGKLIFARNALEASFRESKNQNIKGIRHWPSLDLIISVTYKLEDCISCLRYIEWGLLHDPKFEKAIRIRDKIYEEHPYLSSDPEIQKRTPIPRPIEYIPRPPKKEPELKQLIVHNLKFLDLIQCIVSEYHEGGDGRMKDITLPISVEFKEKSEENLVEMEDVQAVLNGVIDKVEAKLHDEEEEMEVDQKVQQSEEATICFSILNDVVNSAVNQSRMRNILDGIVDFAVGESLANSMSKRRSAGASAAFLNEVPLDLIEKRRSGRSRMRGAGSAPRIGLDSNSESLMESPRGDDMTAKALLESLLPPTLLENSDDEDGTKSSKSNTPIKKKVVKSPEKQAEEEKKVVVQETKWIPDEEETNLVKKMLSETMAKTSVNSSLSDILLHVTNLFSQTFYWPKEFDKAYLDLYLCWRPHFMPPDECEPQSPHKFLEAMLIANEIISRELEPLSASHSENDQVLQRVEALSEFWWDDLQHLVLNIFRLPRTMGVRILSLHLYYYKFNGKIREAAGIADKMQPFLNEVKPEDLKTPIKDYEIFRKEKVAAYIETQKNRQLISKVNQLYADEEYTLVNDVLLVNLDLTSNSSKIPALTETRLYHLLMMVETQWNLNNYAACQTWAEQAFHEIMNYNGEDDFVTPEDKLNLLKTFECCVVMLDGDFSALEERARLSSNLLKLILMQIDGNEECGLGEKTLLPWTLLYHLIKHDEKAMEEFEDDVPCSVNFLCSAHDYLGQMSLCTLEKGKILILLAEGIVATLFKGVSGKGTSDQLCKNMEQALFCLYAHPTKKSKARHLVDHGCNNITFTWELSFKPYVFLRPKKLPEYDDLRSASIVSETVVFFKRIIALVPGRFRIKKREKMVRKYLHDPNAKELPSFENLDKDDDEDDEVMCIDDDSTDPYPAVMIDLFYLMADYYFKNSEFGQAVEYYLIDLSFNPKRVDAWVPLSLSLASGLDIKINEMKDPNDSSSKIEEISKELVKKVLIDAKAIQKSFSKSIELQPLSTTIRIEGANFAYTMVSFCGRQMSDENVENLSMEMFAMIEDLKPKFMDFAIEHYNNALSLTDDKANDDGTIGHVDNNEHDERWLIYMMKGKIYEKEKKPFLQSLDFYQKAMENLISQGATLPKKINFNSPPEMALELLEVYYRFHASILKMELKDEDFPPSLEMLKTISEKVKDIDKIMSPAIVDGPGKNDPSKSATNDKEKQSEDEEPSAKKAKLDDNSDPEKAPEELSEVDQVWSSIADGCIKALELTVQRFSNHFKAIHLLGRYFLRSKKKTDLKKARKLLWGMESGAPPARSGGGNHASLFGDRKGNNLFNGIWRLPLSEVDRAGTFSTHMGNALNTLIDLANAIKDHHILFEVSILIRKPPNSDQKFLFEKQRKSFSKQAYTNAKQILKSKVEKCIQLGKGKEPQLALLLEVHQINAKVRKAWQTKDENLVAFMIDLYKIFQVVPSVTFDEVNTFCVRASSSRGLSYSNSNSRQTDSTSTRATRETTSSANQTRALATSVSSSTSATKAATAGSSSAEAAAAALGITDPNQMKAAMDYINVASAYNELVMASMLTGSGGTSADAQAYLSAYAAATASYTSLLNSLPNTISVSKADKKSNPNSGTSSRANSSPSSPSAASATSSSVSKVQSTKSPSVSITASKVTPINLTSSSTKPSTSVQPKSKLSLANQKKSGGASASPLNLSPSVSLSKTTVPKGSPSTSSNSSGSVGAKGSLVMSKVTPSNAAASKKSEIRQLAPGVTVSIQKEVGKSSNPTSKKPATSLTKLPNVSASAVASAKKLLQSTNPNSIGTTTASKPTPAQEAMAKLKSFRSSLPNSLKRTSSGKPPSKPAQKSSSPAVSGSSAVIKSSSSSSGSNASSKATTPKPPPKVINLDEDEDVICID